MVEKVALLDSINPAAHQEFSEAGFEVVTFPKSLTVPELTELVKDVNLLGIRSGPNIPREVIEASQKLEAIGCFCVRTSVDLDAANENGVAIFNSAHENTRSVAEYVIASTFALLRRIPEHNETLRRGEWSKTDELSHEVRGKKMGIVGYGAIGSQVSELAESIGMDVIFYDPMPQLARGRAQRVDSLDSLLAEADVVTLHVPDGVRTWHLINAEKLALMKPNSYLINASGAEVIDSHAVAGRLHEGHLAGVAIDVFEDEPKNRGDGFSHIFQDYSNAIITPHIGGSTKEAQTAIATETASKLLTYHRDYHQSGAYQGTVNLPDMPLDHRPAGTARLIHIHDNVPGVVAELDGLIAEAGYNIIGSTLRTKGTLGYIALDIEGPADGLLPPGIMAEIQRSPTTRRTRVI